MPISEEEETISEKISRKMVHVELKMNEILSRLRRVRQLEHWRRWKVFQRYLLAEFERIATRIDSGATEEELDDIHAAVIGHKVQVDFSHEQIMRGIYSHGQRQMIH